MSLAYYRTKYWLKKKFIDEDLNSEEVGDLCGMSGRSIRGYLKQHKIKKKKVIMDKKHMHLRLSPNLYEKIKSYSRTRKISMSSVFRMALVEYMIKNKLNF